MAHNECICATKQHIKQRNYLQIKKSKILDMQKQNYLKHIQFYFNCKMLINKDFKLFITAFIQVFLVSANTYFISKSFYIGIGIAGFGISWFWTSNVKTISVGTKKQRLIYATGAMIGGLTGVFSPKLIL